MVVRMRAWAVRNAKKVRVTLTLGGVGKGYSERSYT